MAEYVLDHHLEGEGARLALMSRLLDPMHRRHLEALGVPTGAKTLEVGCGNGSVSAWLAEQIGPTGRAVAVDLDLSLVDVRVPNLELRQADIVHVTDIPPPIPNQSRSFHTDAFINQKPRFALNFL